jgi:hypothetical protein
MTSDKSENKCHDWSTSITILDFSAQQKWRAISNSTYGMVLKAHSTKCHSRLTFSTPYLANMLFFHIVLAWFCFGIFLSAIEGRLQGFQREKIYNEQFVSAVNDRISSFRRQVEVEEEYVPVIIGFANDNDEIRDNIVSRLSQFVKRRFQRINAISALVTKAELLDLKQNPNVLYVDDDVLVYSDESGKSEPLLYGLEMVQAFNTAIPSFNSSAACNDPNSFKVGIVDSGMAM